MLGMQRTNGTNGFQTLEPGGRAEHSGLVKGGGRGLGWLVR